MITAKQLFDALSVIRKVPLGAQEQIVFMAIAADESGPGLSGGVSAASLSEQVYGDNGRKSNVAVRAVVNRLREKKMVEAKYTAGGERLIKLSKAGRDVMKKSLAATK